jgi:two-component system cell cycle response regulator
VARVLIVDDSKSVRNAAGKMLANEFDVATAEDGEEAWAMLGFDPTIQVVFTDLNMPNRNGYELIRSIRTAADARVRGLPIIVVTGVEQDEVARVRSLELGATDFITKPFSSLDLLARARAHANYQQVTQDLRAQVTAEPLTGLANNAGFLARLQQDMAYAQRHEHALSLAILEIENFRELYLKHGKQSAERLLVEFAAYLRESIRKEDTAGRTGLGEFALSLPGGEPAGVARLVAKAQRELLAIASRLSEGRHVVGFRTALIQPHVDGRTRGQDALDAARAQLIQSSQAAASVPPVTAPTLDSAAHVEAPTQVAARVPIAAGTSSTLHLDPLLDSLDRGDALPARKEMRGVIRRLIPVFRIMTADQRAQLVTFLQRMPP